MIVHEPEVARAGTVRMMPMAAVWGARSRCAIRFADSDASALPLPLPLPLPLSTPTPMPYTLCPSVEYNLLVYRIRVIHRII